LWNSIFGRKDFGTKFLPLKFGQTRIPKQQKNVLLIILGQILRLYCTKGPAFINMFLTILIFVRKFRPKLFHKIDPRPNRQKDEYCWSRRKSFTLLAGDGSIKLNKSSHLLCGREKLVNCQ
jgi:hypothetical protein